MAYEKLSRRALGCMYTAEIIGDVISIVLIGIVNIFWLIPKQIEIGRWISAVLLIYAAVSMLVEPYFRYNRYRYSINEECIDIREGYLFVKRNIVPIERLHKLEISKGPIDQIFHVAKVTVTTAGGDVTLRFLEEEKAEKIAENLQKRINEIVKDENEKLQVFQKGGPYLATKKIGKNNPKEEEIRADNYLRQEWNRNVDRALLTGASEVEVMMAKQSQIDEPVAESLREHGQDPKLFTGILQKAVGYLRGFVEFLREMKYFDRDSEGNPLIDHDMRIDITPEPLPARTKGERPSSEKQEAEVMRLQQILNKMKKQEQKIYAIEKAIVKFEKDLKEVKKNGSTEKIRKNWKERLNLRKFSWKRQRLH